MSKHTPGPWSLGSDSTKERLVVNGAADESGKSWRVCSMPARTEADVANARFIAAAPELLDACRVAFNYMRLSGRPSEALGRVQTQLRAAIAKAEGES